MYTFLGKYTDMLGVFSKASEEQHKRAAILLHNVTLNRADVDFWSWSKINFQWSFAYWPQWNQVLPVILSIYLFWKPLWFSVVYFVVVFVVCFFLFPSMSALPILFLIPDYQKWPQPEENTYLCISLYKAYSVIRALNYRI